MPVTSPRNHPRRARARLSVAALAFLVALILVIAGGTGTASAHATLVATTPADGQSVPSDTLDLVTATFSESVSAEVGGLTIRNREGDVVDNGDSGTGGAVLSVSVPTDLPEGTYIATYRVLSADGHPISGSWLFGIGTGPVDPSAASAEPPSDAGWEVAGAIARFVTYVTALVAAGVAFFLAFIHDRRNDRWKLVPVVRISAVAGLFGIAGTIVAQAALLTGQGLSAATDGVVLRSVLTDKLGWASVVLLLGLAAVHLSTDTGHLLTAQILAFYGGLAVVVSFALWGHDTQAPYRWLSIGSDIVHVAAAAVWLGGLVGLVVVLRRRAPHPVRSTAGIVTRFSTAAAISVVGLILAGGTMGWIETGSLDALFTTTYGRLVLVKVAVTAGVLVLAALNRFRLVPAIVTGAEADPDDPDPAVVSANVGARSASLGSETPGRTSGGAVAVDDPTDDPVESDQQARRWLTLRRTVSYEALALVVVLAFTAVLVNTTPGRDAVQTRPRVVNLTDDTDTGTVNLVVTPAKVGTNGLHIQYADQQGRPIDVADTLTVEMSLPDKDLGPITRQVAKLSPGHYILEGDELSLAGDWTIVLSVRTSDFTEERSSFSVPIAK